MRDRLPRETATDALREWIRERFKDEDECTAERRTRRRVIRADDALRAYEHHHTLRVQQIIAAVIAHDLGVSADDLEPRMAAAATLTVFDLLGRGPRRRRRGQAVRGRRSRAAVHRRRDQRSAPAFVARSGIFSQEPSIALIADKL